MLTDGTRLLTLTGPGGVGKTRLALHLAHEMAGACPDGVWFVELADLDDVRLVAPTVAERLGIDLVGEDAVTPWSTTSPAGASSSCSTTSSRSSPPPTWWRACSARATACRWW